MFLWQRMIAAAGVALMAAALAAGCSGSTVINPNPSSGEDVRWAPNTVTATGSGDQFVITEIPTDNLDVVFADGAYYFTGIIDGFISYIAHGAGGCPPVIEAIEHTQDSIVLVGKDWGDGPCAESYVLVHQRIERADGQPIPEDQHVEVVNPSEYYQ